MITTAAPTSTRCQAKNPITCPHHGQGLVRNKLMNRMEDDYGMAIFDGEAGQARREALAKLINLVSQFPDHTGADVFQVRHEARRRMQQFRILDTLESVDTLIDEISSMQEPNDELAPRGLPHKKATGNPYMTVPSMNDFFGRKIA